MTFTDDAGRDWTVLYLMPFDDTMVECERFSATHRGFRSGDDRRIYRFQSGDDTTESTAAIRAQLSASRPGKKRHAVARGTSLDSKQAYRDAIQETYARRREGDWRI